MRAGDVVRSLATVSGLDGSGLPLRLGQEFFSSPYSSRPDVGPTQLLVQWVPKLFPGDLSGLGVVLVTYAHLAPSSEMSRAIPLLPSLSVVTCYGETLRLLLTHEVRSEENPAFI